jgi:hypothetical protein
MTFLEKNLEDILFDAMQSPSVWDKLIEKGIEEDRPYMAKRQLKIGNYGTCDLITFTRRIADFPGDKYVLTVEPCIITIYELKQNIIDVNALIQVNRYMKGVSEWMKKHKSSFYRFRIQGVLIGREINTKSDYLYLFEHFRNEEHHQFGQISVYTYDYKFDGIEFNSIDLTAYSLVNEGF